MRSFIQTINPIINPIYKKQGFVEAKMILDWELIMGDFAKFCVPEKIHFPYQKRTNGTLKIKTISAFAPEISYHEPIIIDKINRYFGYKAVAKLSISHLHMPPPRKIKTESVKVPPEQEEALKNSIADIKNPQLNEALYELGMAMLRKKK